MDAFDQLALRAAQDVLDVEKHTPGEQDRAIIAAAEMVLRILTHKTKPTKRDPGDQPKTKHLEMIPGTV